MTAVQITRIEQAIAEREALGDAWTNIMIYDVVKPIKYSTLAAYLKQRRAQAVTMPPDDLEGDALAVDTSPEEQPGLAAEDARGATITPEADPPALPAPEALPDASGIPRLARLQQAAREADETLRRLTDELASHRQQVQAAALALHQARRAAQRLVGELRQAARHALYADNAEALEARARVRAMQAQLAALVGAPDAQQIANDWHYLPSWAREG